MIDLDALDQLHMQYPCPRDYQTTMRNTYPSLAAEIRELRQENERLCGMVKVLEEVLRADKAADTRSQMQIEFLRARVKELGEEKWLRSLECQIYRKP